MCEFKKMEFYVSGPEQNKALQEVLLKQGYAWPGSGGVQYYLDKPWLHTGVDGKSITWWYNSIDGYMRMDTQKYIDDFYKEAQMNKLVTMDKQYTYRDGSPARILCVDAVGYGEGFDVISLDQKGNIWWHQQNGKRIYGNIEKDLIEVSPYAHIKIDDKVIVWMNVNNKYERHFAGITSDGKPMVWDDGKTSFTTKIKSTWNFCEKVED